MKTITKDILTAAKFASTDESRPVLTAVKVTDKGYAATDSYKLVMIKHKGADIKEFPVIPNAQEVKELPEPLLIPAAALLKKLKFPTSKTLPILGEGLLCNAEKGSVAIATTDLETATTLQFRTIDGTFPEYQKIMPTGEPVVTIMLDAKLVTECMAAFLDGETNQVRLDLYGETEPMIMTGKSENNDHIKALLMPCKI